MIDNIQIPKWQKELMSFKGIISTFIIEGNISDEYPFFKNDREIEFLSLNDLIPEIFNSLGTEGLYDIKYCDLIFGITERGFSASENLDKKTESPDNILLYSEKIRQTITIGTTENGKCKNNLIIVNFTSRFLNSPDPMTQTEIAFFQNLFYASNNPQQINSLTNSLILVVNKLNDIPAWFYINNPNVRTITIPNPDRATRSIYIDNYFDCFSENKTAELDRIKTKFIDITEGMKILELSELQRLHEKSHIPAEEITDAVTIYKYGFKDNKWSQIKEKLNAINMKEVICKRIKGQGHIIDKIVKVIKRAVVGLSGVQHTSGTKPRGILFLAGPTGTGKTETVKVVTDLLFQDEKTLIRFDMSEYSAEHADQKLFGAPPGYVGYDSGGQLTNAVKNNPFSVLLFDEIEKAHPKIMDKFLQILEDGRMTDGQGNTVYFTETLIFFTSNIGISREFTDPNTGVTIREILVFPDEPLDVIEGKVLAAMNAHYKPEVMGRFGKNILVFNYIDINSSKEIAKTQIDNINSNYQKTHKIEIIMSDTAYDFLHTLCWQDEVRLKGGRGIGNVIEDVYLNQLAEFIFDSNIRENDTIKVSNDNEKFIFTKGAGNA